MRLVNGTIREDRVNVPLQEIVPKLVGYAEAPEPYALDVCSVRDAKLIAEAN